jgi:hypothetical protein
MSDLVSILAPILSCLGSALFFIVLIGGIVGLACYPFFHDRAQVKNLLKNGVPAPAVVLSTKETNFSMSTFKDFWRQIVVKLKVEPADRPPFEVEFKSFFKPGDYLSMYDGVKVQVRFDPNDTKKVAIENIPSFQESLDALDNTESEQEGDDKPAADPNLDAALLAQDQYYDKLRTTGVEARAKVLLADNMKIRVSGDTGWMFHFMLDVTDSTTGEHFSSQTQAAVKDSGLHKYQAGKEVIVRYDPAHKEQVALVRAAGN